MLCSDLVIYKLASDHLSYAMPGSEFAMATRRGWDGRVRLLKAHGHFPTGLVPRLVALLKKEEVEFKITDKRTQPPKLKCDLKLNSSFTPRDYQSTAAALTDHESRGVFVLGTGGGKSMLAGLITARRNTATLVVTPDTGLREQLGETFAYLFGDRNVSTNLKIESPIVVANIQALANLEPSAFERFGMLIVDEFHHAASKTYRKVNSYCVNAFHRYGFTGTFTRPDGADMDMHGVLSEVVFKKTTSELIEEGWLVRPEITIVRHEVKGWSKLNYQAAYIAIIEDPAFNKIVADIANEKIGEGKRTLVLVRRKDHGDLLSRMIKGAVYLSGDDSVEWRKSIVKQFTRKEILCIVATNIFGEGTDIPSIEVLVNARCQKTEIQTKQGIGRALRKTENKEKAEVFDFLIIGQKHLKQHSIERIQAYREEPAFRISVRRTF